MMEYNTHVKTPKMQHLKTTACFCKQDNRLVKFIIFLTEINILVYGHLECLLKYIFYCYPFIASCIISLHKLNSKRYMYMFRTEDNMINMNAIGGT